MPFEAPVIKAVLPVSLRSMQQSLQVRLEFGLEGRTMASASAVRNTRDTRLLCSGNDVGDGAKPATGSRKVRYPVRHSIKSSARTNIDGGIESPRDCAVLVFTAS